MCLYILLNKIFTSIITSMKTILVTAYYIFFGMLMTFLIVTLIIVVYSLVLIFTFNKEKARYFSHCVGKIWGKVTAGLAFMKLNLEGLENYDKNKVYIITSNHQSAFDIVFCLRILDGDFAFVAKDTLFKIPFFGLAMKLAGYIPVKRGGIGALKSLDDMAVTISKNISVLIYPEGTRSVTGQIGRPKKGMLKLAEICGGDIEILPIVFDGTRNVVKPKTTRVSLFQKANARILKPYKVSDTGATDNEKLDYWYDMMTSNFKDVKVD